MNDPLLLEVYTRYKNFKKAADLAYDLYENTEDASYLAKSAIFEYEASKDKNDENMLKEVVKKLKKAVEYSPSALNLNYLGYILIDHNIDLLKGIEYVQKALELEGDSAYYLDSLAWGYFKLGECEKAQKTIEKAIKLEGGDDPEVLEHYKKIKKCKILKKGKNKQ